ncbi:MAG: DUF4992 family lipoprotein, partial [Mangrovibacterium sp.]
GFKDDQVFSSDVKNAQLESPSEEDITVEAVSNSTGGQDLKFSWPVVYGAGGYEFSLYNVDDAENPVVVGEENQVIDGCSVIRARAEDTKYKVVVKTLGNEKLNNTAAEEPTTMAYTTLVPVFQTIPTGTDLAAFFTANPIQPADKATEIVYELAPGGEYTMSGNVELKSTNITLRADKLNRANLTVNGDASFVSDGAGFRMKWINIDATNYTGSALIQYNSTIDETNPFVIYDSGNAPWVVVEATSGIESSNIKGINKPFIADNGKKYALRNFTFKDCVVEMGANFSGSFINFKGALIKELSLVNSTVYNLNENYDAFWAVYAQVQVIQVADRVVWATEKGSINILNSTLWKLSYAKKGIFNANAWGKTSNSVTVKNSIIEDCGSQMVLRYFKMNNDAVAGYFANNTYWYDGAFAELEITDSKGDKTGTELRDDPGFKDPANGDFTVSGAAQIEKRTGDPRWLPAQ